MVGDGSNGSYLDQNGLYLAQDNKCGAFKVSILILMLLYTNFCFCGIKIRIKLAKISGTTKLQMKGFCVSALFTVRHYNVQKSVH